MLGSLCYVALFPPKTWSQFSLGALRLYFYGFDSLFLLQSKKHPKKRVLLFLVDPKGFEPSTSALRTQRSPNWAMNPYMILIKFRLACICHRQRQPSSSNWAMNPYMIACRHYGKRYYTTTEGKMQPAFIKKSGLHFFICQKSVLRR